MRHITAILLATLLAIAATPARAELALAAGAAWSGTGHEGRAAGSLGWRTGLGGGSWASEVRGSTAGASWTLRTTPRRPLTVLALRPAAGAGFDFQSAGRSALVRVGGFHVEGSLAYPLPEGSALELTARWIQRGERAPRGPEAFASRYAEVTLGFVFSLR